MTRNATSLPLRQPGWMLPDMFSIFARRKLWYIMGIARILYRWSGNWVEELLKTRSGLGIGEFDLESTISASTLAVRVIVITERIYLEIAKPDAIRRFVA